VPRQAVSYFSDVFSATSTLVYSQARRRRPWLNICLRSPNIGLYAIDPNPLRYGSEIPQTSFLKVPDLEKNFLISPPGSPPEGWEPIREDPPNLTPLADDLIAALKQLQLRRHGSGVEVVLDPNEGSGIRICVQDCCDDELDHVETEWIHGQRTPSHRQWQPTALPPLPTYIS